MFISFNFKDELLTALFSGVYTETLSILIFSDVPQIYGTYHDKYAIASYICIVTRMEQHSYVHALHDNLNNTYFIQVL